MFISMFMYKKYSHRIIMNVIISFNTHTQPFVHTNITMTETIIPNHKT